MRKMKNSEKKLCIFIDFKSAYNTKKKNKYMFLIKLKGFEIYQDNKIELLKVIYQNSFF
jgi:hypothetical protein